MQKGAQPTDPVRKLLEISGAWSRFKVAKGQIHTVASKPVPPQEVAETPQVATEVEKSDPAPEPAPEAVPVAEDVAVKTEESSA